MAILIGSRYGVCRLVSLVTPQVPRPAEFLPSGAGSVLQHVVARGGETRSSLFRAAITSSTFLPSQYHYNDPIPEASHKHHFTLYYITSYMEQKIYSEVVTRAKSAFFVLAAPCMTLIGFHRCSAVADTLSCLRSVNVDTIWAAGVAITKLGFFGTFTFAPVVDELFITQRPTEAMKQGKVNGVRYDTSIFMMHVTSQPQDVYLAVTNTNEGPGFINPQTPATVNVQNYVTKLFPKFRPQDAAAAAAQYHGLGTPLNQITLIMGEGKTLSVKICD